MPMLAEEEYYDKTFPSIDAFPSVDKATELSEIGVADDVNSPVSLVIWTTWTSQPTVIF